MSRGWGFLGLDFSLLEPDAMVDRIASRAAEPAAFSYVVTPNVDHCVRLAREPALGPLYTGAWMTVCDSRILQLLARLDGMRLPTLPGVDLVDRLLRTRVDPLEPVVVIGGTVETLSGLRARYALAELRWLQPPQGLRTDAGARATVVRYIIDNPARWVFLAVGSPQQEMIAAEAAATGVARGLAVCCGASLEFLSGQLKRAPAWMRELGLEWLHRLLSEPGRLWRRYLVDGPAIAVIWWRSRARRSGKEAGR